MDTRPSPIFSNGPGDEAKELCGEQNRELFSDIRGEVGLVMLASTRE